MNSCGLGWFLAGVLEDLTSFLRNLLRNRRFGVDLYLYPLSVSVPSVGSSYIWEGIYLHTMLKDFKSISHLLKPIL